MAVHLLRDCVLLSGQGNAETGFWAPDLKLCVLLEHGWLYTLPEIQDMQQCQTRNEHKGGKRTDLAACLRLISKVFCTILAVNGWTSENTDSGWQWFEVGILDKRFSLVISACIKCHILCPENLFLAMKKLEVSPSLQKKNESRRKKSLCQKPWWDKSPDCRKSGDKMIVIDVNRLSLWKNERIVYDQHKNQCFQ